MAEAVAQDEVAHIDTVFLEAQEVIEVWDPGVLLVEMLGNALDPAQLRELFLGQPQSIPGLPESPTKALVPVSPACQSPMNTLKGTQCLQM